MLDADVIVLEARPVLGPGTARKPLGDVRLIRAGPRARAGHLRDAVELLVERLLHRGHRDAHLRQQRRDDAVGRLDQGGKQMLDVHPLVIPSRGQGLGLAQGFL